MRYVTVSRISLSQYNDLRDAGIKVNFSEPKRITRYVATIKAAASTLELSVEGRPIKRHVSLSTLVPYARIKDYKRL